MDNQVKGFYNNEKMRDAVRAYFKQKMDEAIVKKVYLGEDVSHVKDAKELIDKIFHRMAVEAKDKPVV